MKTATLPPLRVEPELRSAVEKALKNGESLTSFMEAALRESLERRQTQAAFIARGLASERRAQASGKYVSAHAVLRKLERRLAKAKRRSTRKGSAD